MKIEIKPSRLEGTVHVPGSKSIGHRMLILAALSEGETCLENLPANEDIAATVDCLQALGSEITSFDGLVTVKESKRIKNEKERLLPCRESGSTLRFLLPLTLDGNRTRFTGSERLMSRPLSIYEELCRKDGFIWENGPDGLRVQGKLRSGDYSIPGNVSSQFITGLLLALPKVEGESRLILTTEAESLPYIVMTLAVLKQFGFTVKGSTKDGFRISGNQKGRSPGRVVVPGDESGAAFFGGLNILGNKLQVEGLSENGWQGDAVWRDYFPMLEKGCPTLSVKNCPDLAPVLAVTAALKNGVVLTDTSRLSYKESDRGQAVREELARCGVDVQVEENRMIIPGGRVKSPDSAFQSHNDHRIAMAMAVLATEVGGTIEGAEAVSKSMPEFWHLLKGAGAKLERIQ